jgi:hypothetical protein
MFVTTAQWQSEPSPELVEQFNAKTAQMLTDFESDKTLSRLDDGVFQATRTWPDQAKADEWCAFVTGLGAISATVSSYP